MHEVHALIRRRLPGAISARTDWMFGFHRRGVRRCECDTDIPKPGPLPHTSHTAATVDHSQKKSFTERGADSTRNKTVQQSNRSWANVLPRVRRGRVNGGAVPPIGAEERHFAQSCHLGWVTSAPCCR